MSDTKYAYAVARIRALENGLFSSAQIEQLLSVKSYEGALRFLTEHGWGDADTPLSAEAILTREKTKTWETVRDLLKGDDAILAVLSYGDLYHNLKAAIKDAAAPGSHGNVYFDDCEVDGVRNAEGNVLGSYLHGLFDDGQLFGRIAAHIREQKGIQGAAEAPMTMEAFREREFDRVAAIVRDSLDMEAIYAIIRGER